MNTKTKIISAGIGIAALLLVVVIGFKGLLANIKTSEFVYVSHEFFERDPGQFKNYMVRVDSIRIVGHPMGMNTEHNYRIFPVIIAGINEDTSGKEGFKFFIKFDPQKKDIIMNYPYGQTVSGIVKRLNRGSLEKYAENAPAIQDEAYMINTVDSPIAWYLNLLLILVPQIFIYLLANTIYVLAKNEALLKTKHV